MKRQVGERWSGDERGVAPVLAVLLMVGIVLIMAVAVTQFTTGVSDQAQDAAPSVVWDYDWEPGTSTVTITHDTGQTIVSQDTMNVEVQISDADGSGSEGAVWTLPIESGSTFVIEDGVTGADTLDPTFTPEEGDQIRIIWTSPRGKSFIIGQYRISQDQ